MHLRCGMIIATCLKQLSSTVFTVMRIFLLLCCLIVSSVVTVRSQDTADKITPEEYIEANELAQRFSERLLETKDFTPIIGDLFAENFERDFDSDSFFGIDRKFHANLSDGDRRRYFVAINNWLYLYSLVVFSQNSSTSTALDQDYFTKRVIQILKKDPVLRKGFRVLILEGESDELPLIDTKAKLTAMLRSLDRVTAYARETARLNKAGNTNAWKETMKDFRTRFKYFKPWVRNCIRDCYSRPKGTRIITVNAEIFQLDLLRIQGRLRIVGVSYYFD